MVQKSKFRRKFESSVFETKSPKIDHRGFPFRSYISSFCRKIKNSSFEPKLPIIDPRGSLVLKNRILVDKSRIHISTHNVLKSTLQGPYGSRIEFWSKNRKFTFRPKWPKIDPRWYLVVKNRYLGEKLKVNFSIQNDQQSTLVESCGPKIAFP